METGSKYHGRNVALYFAGERPANPADYEFKGHAIDYVSAEPPFKEMIEVSNEEAKVVLGREADDTHWTAVIRDPMTQALCARAVFEIDIIP